MKILTNGVSFIAPAHRAQHSHKWDHWLQHAFAELENDPMQAASGAWVTYWCWALKSGGVFYYPTFFFTTQTAAAALNAMVNTPGPNNYLPAFGECYNATWRPAATEKVPHDLWGHWLGTH